MVTVPSWPATRTFIPIFTWSFRLPVSEQISVAGSPPAPSSVTCTETSIRFSSFTVEAKMISTASPPMITASMIHSQGPVTCI